MIDLCYHFTLALHSITMDGDKFSLTIGLRPVFIQPSSQINYHLDKLSSGEGRWVKFIRGVDVVMGGAPVHHDRRMKMFSWKD